MTADQRPTNRSTVSAFYALYTLLMIGGLIAFMKGTQDGTWLELATQFKNHPSALLYVIGFGFAFSKLIGQKFIHTAILLIGISAVVLIGASITLYIIQ